MRGGVGGRLAEGLRPVRWEPVGRPAPLPHYVPGGDFDPGGRHSLAMFAGSRGSGKTEHATRYFNRWMRENPGARGRIIGPTLGDVVESCVNGPSGLRAMDPDVEFKPAQPGGAQVVWPNGSQAVLLGTYTPSDVERFRATGNRHIDWWEELAACGRNGSLLKDAWDQAKFGLRLGSRPHSIASTTPKSHPAYMRLHKAESTYLMVGTVFQNPHLPQSYKDELVRVYEGTRIGRQELYGELLEDAEGALWLTDTIAEVMYADDAEFSEAGGQGKTVVAIDPSIGAGEPDSDECGIIVGCLAQNDPSSAWVLADYSLRGDPGKWARAVKAAFHDWGADYAVAESNQGGRMVAETLGRYAAEIPLRTVHAKRGKQLRAEPVSILSEQGRVRLLARSAKLEEQMTTWEPYQGYGSPDRLDAFVYCVLELLPRGGANRELMVDTSKRFRSR